MLRTKVLSKSLKKLQIFSQFKSLEKTKNRNKQKIKRNSLDFKDLNTTTSWPKRKITWIWTWNIPRHILILIWLISWSSKISTWEWEVVLWPTRLYIDFWIWTILRLNPRILKVIQCNLSMECQFCSQLTQVLRHMLIMSTMTCHSAIHKITDGKCLKDITTTLSFREENTETELDNKFQKVLDLNCLMLLIKITQWS